MRTARRPRVPLALVGGGLLVCLTGCGPLPMMMNPIALAGDATAALHPGTAVPVDLEITNTRMMPVEVREIRVEITRISAPNATELHPCSLEDYTIAQTRPTIAIAVAALASKRLSASTLPVAEWPQVHMLNRQVNQDGCKGATLTLRYSARAMMAVAR